MSGAGLPTSPASFSSAAWLMLLVRNRASAAAATTNVQRIMVSLLERYRPKCPLLGNRRTGHSLMRESVPSAWRAAGVMLPLDGACDVMNVRVKAIRHKDSFYKIHFK